MSDPRVSDISYDQGIAHPLIREKIDGLHKRISLLEAENKALREQLRWVPVSELPEVDEDILVYSTYGGIDIGQYYGDGEWSDSASHWMPLPSPPMESGQ